MSRKDEITRRDLAVARLLGWAPWIGFLLASLPLPLVFVILYFFASTTEGAAVSMLLALSSLALGAVLGLVVALLLVLYRRRWMKNLRERIAADGITAGELSWFTHELTRAERQALKAMEAQDPLLADAYRETLAAKLTACRVIASVNSDMRLVERRLNKAAYIHGTDTKELVEELRADRERLEQTKLEGVRRRAEAEARLQMIEAAANRGANWEQTQAALRRLAATNDQMPLALEAVRLEQSAREEVEREMRQTDPQALTKG
ncbi:MAG TPA: hypothetical protein VF507_04065 [Pyrinomonadaceae bacterium]|jgi:hypothetical protein